MDEKILIAIILGITFGLAILISSSKRFSVIQKGIIWVLIVFPPAQWLFVLLAFLYNSLVVNEKIKESIKTNNHKDSLLNQLSHNKKDENLFEENVNKKTLYYLALDGLQVGPLSFDELMEKGIENETLIWRKGMGSWKKAQELKEVKSAIIDNPPPIPKGLNEEPPPLPKKIKTLKKYLINEKEFTMDEIEKELKNGNYIVNRNSIIYDEKGNEFTVEEFKFLSKYFPPS